MNIVLFFLSFFFLLHICYNLLNKKVFGFSRLNDLILIFSFLLFLNFFILIYLKIFKVIPVFFSFFLPSIFLNFFNLSYKKFYKIFLKDLKTIFFFTIKDKTFYLFLFLIFVLILRVSILPPLGWDALTCHLVKAALWAKYGSFNYLRFPGEWSFYQSFQSGGSIFPSYILLFFKNDLFLTFIDIFYYIILSGTILKFGKAIKVSKKKLFFGTQYILFIPTVILCLGSLYVDLFLSIFTLKAVYYLYMFFKKKENYYLNLFSISSGLSASVKISIILPIFILLFFAFLWSLKIKKIKYFLFSTFLFLIPSSPFIYESFKITNYPFGFFPVKIFNIKLGLETPGYKWYTERKDLENLSLKKEISLFLKMFGNPFKTNTSLSFFSIFPIFLYFFLFKKFFKENKYFHFILLIFFFSFFILYFNSGFKVVRVLWAEVNGRLFFPYFLPLFLFSLKFEEKIYTYYLFYSSLINYASSIFFGWAFLEFIIVPVLLIFLFFIFIFFKKYKFLFKIFFIFFFSLILFLKNGFRYYFLENSYVFHPIPKDWVCYLPLMDKPEKKKVACTAGLWQNADNWFLFYIFGKNLQNEIFYIPINKEIIDFEKDYKIYKSADYDFWIDGLKNKNIQYIISFPPTSIEVIWMERHKENFSFLKGAKGVHGVYIFKN